MRCLSPGGPWRRAVKGAPRLAARWLSAVWLLVLALAGAGRVAAAQNVLSVPFTNGFIGVRGSSAGSANAVKTYATLGIARTFLIQNSSTGQFQVQGNDVPGTLRIVRTSGAIVDIEVTANWRQNNGQTTYFIGFLPKPGTAVTLAYSGGTVQITDGTNPGGSNIGGYVAAYPGPFAADDSSASGNAAQSGVLTGLNNYLATVAASRPAGPVTVAAQSTTNPTPTVTGTATLAAGEQLSVVVGGAQYTTATSPAVVRSGAAWSLALTAALAPGPHDVAATITNADGFTLSDATLNELTVAAPVTPVTLAGSFTATGRAYDGTTAAALATNALTLAGVQAGHAVTLASVTVAFQTAAAGAGKTVAVTGFTLGGADAGRYTPSLANAPTATATVAPRALTVTGVTAADKVYDRTTTATLVGAPAYANLAPNESFTVAGTPAAAFATAAVGQAKPVTVTGFLPPTANYTVAQPAGLAANVTARTLTLGGSFTAADKVYDGTTAATIATNALTLAGVVPGDAVTLGSAAAAFATAAVGQGKPVAITGATLAGADAGNYAVTVAGAPTAAAAITAAGGTVTLAGTFTAQDKVYDGTTAAAGNTAGLTLAGVQGNDQVTIASVTLAFQTAAAGAGKTVRVASFTLGGAQAGAYAASTAGAPTAPAAVTPRPLTVAGTFTVADRPFDGTTAAPLATNALTLAGVVANDPVTLGAVTAAFATPAVGQGKPVTLTGGALAGAAAANYTLSLAGAPTTTASITAAPVASAAPPSAPLNVAATAGDRTLALTWAPPAVAGCSAVTGYAAEVSTDGGATWTAAALGAPSGTSAALAGLTNNRPYLVRVAAANACGTGPASAAAGPVVPLAPARDVAGQLPPAPAGTAAATAGGVARPVTLDVVQDTVLRLSAAGPAGFTLRLRALDQPGAAIPLDSTRVATLEQGGRAVTEGAGFLAGTVASVYLYAAGGAPVLLGTAPVAPDGSFAGSLPVADTLAAGAYTLQVNGVDQAGAARSVALGLEVAAPPPELTLAATPSDRAPAVGDTITITLAVTNAGRGPAVDVVIPRAFTEPGFRVLGAVPAGPADGTYDAPSTTWRIPRIAVGGQARLLFTAVVLPPDRAAAASAAAPAAAPAASAMTPAAASSAASPTASPAASSAASAPASSPRP